MNTRSSRLWTLFHAGGAACVACVALQINEWLLAGISAGVCFWFIGVWYEQADSAQMFQLQDDLLEHQRKLINECFDTIKHLKQGYEQNRPSDVVDKDDPDW